MNEIVNKFLLAGDKFMLEMHLKQPGFTCSACELFPKNKERVQKFKKTEGTSYIYKNELDKSSNINEVIRVVLNSFFLQKNFTRTKSTNSTKSTESTKSTKSTKRYKDT